MKRLILMVPAFLLFACEGQPPHEPVENDPLLQTTGPHEVWFSDYYTPLVPAAYGLRTYEITAGEPFGEQATSWLDELHTAPYTSGERTGILLFFESSWDDEVQLLHVENKLLYILNEESYYLSTDCSLTAFPPWLVLGRVSDGMILEQNAPAGQKVWRVHHDLSQPECLEGAERTWSYLIQIRNVRVGGERYNNALLTWILVPEAFRTLDFGGKESDLGITLPGSSDTGGKAVVGLGIYGFHRGMLGGAEVNLDGTLDHFVELVSIERP
jgi:hypothetical protein